MELAATAAAAKHRRLQAKIEAHENVNCMQQKNHDEAVVKFQGQHAEAVVVLRGQHAEAVVVLRGQHAETVVVLRGQHAETEARLQRQLNDARRLVGKSDKVTTATEASLAANVALVKLLQTQIAGQQASALEHAETVRQSEAATQTRIDEFIKERVANRQYVERLEARNAVLERVRYKGDYHQHVADQAMADHLDGDE